MSVAIINNGGANMNSLIYALDRLGVASTLTTDTKAITAASHVILPGVGHATDSMNRLRNLDAEDTIRSLRQPVLGICLGMQLMYRYSEEGDTECLDLIDGRVSKMAGSVERPAPHMGWNQIDIAHDHPLLNGIASGSHFYFVHGYTAEVNEWTVASSSYSYDFAAIAAKDNFVGVQFHPERSGPTGARLLHNFVNMT